MCGDADWRQQYSPAVIDASPETGRPSRYEASARKCNHFDVFDADRGSADTAAAVEVEFYCSTT